MTVVLVGAVGFFLGLLAHDLGVQALSDDTRLSPFAGTCPSCDYRRGWLKPRCAECGRSVSRELLLAIVIAGVAIGFHSVIGPTVLLIPYLAFLTLSAALVITDIDEFRIVDRLNLPGTVLIIGLLAIAAAMQGSWSDLWRGLGGGGLYFAGTTLLFLIGRGRGFGAGDVKLSVQLGVFAAFIDWTTLGRAVFITAMLGGLYALALIVFGSAGRKTELPYGPPMILGAWAAIIISGI